MVSYKTKIHNKSVNVLDVKAWYLQAIIIQLFLGICHNKMLFPKVNLYLHNK